MLEIDFLNIIILSCFFVLVIRSVVLPELSLPMVKFLLKDLLAFLFLDLLVKELSDLLLLDFILLLLDLVFVFLTLVSATIMFYDLCFFGLEC